MGPLSLEILTANFGPGKVRQEHLHGRTYLVGPATTIVPGVLSGSQGSLYYPPEQVAANVSKWDGMPLTAYHPMGPAGEHCSAKDPGVLERQGIGFVRDSVYNGKLQHEFWFDVERVRQVDNTLLAGKPDSQILPRLTRGEPIELSTGLYTDNEPAPKGASHDGRPYEWIASNYRPDHIAVLPDQVGACSLRDGCGVLVNKSTGGEAVLVQDPADITVANLTQNLSAEDLGLDDEQLEDMAEERDISVEELEEQLGITENGAVLVVNTWSDAAREASIAARQATIAARQKTYAITGHYASHESPSAEEHSASGAAGDRARRNVALHKDMENISAKASERSKKALTAAATAEKAASKGDVNRETTSRKAVASAHKSAAENHLASARTHEKAAEGGFGNRANHEEAAAAHHQAAEAHLSAHAIVRAENKKITGNEAGKVTQFSRSIVPVANDYDDPDDGGEDDDDDDRCPECGGEMIDEECEDCDYVENSNPEAAPKRRGWWKVRNKYGREVSVEAESGRHAGRVASESHGVDAVSASRLSVGNRPVKNAAQLIRVAEEFVRNRANHTENADFDSLPSDAKRAAFAAMDADESSKSAHGSSQRAKKIGDKARDVEGHAKAGKAHRTAQIAHEEAAAKHKALGNKKEAAEHRSWARHHAESVRTHGMQGAYGKGGGFSKNAAQVDESPRSVWNRLFDWLTGNANPEGHNQYTNSGAEALSKKASSLTQKAPLIRGANHQTALTMAKAGRHEEAADAHNRMAQDHSERAQAEERKGDKFGFSKDHWAAASAHMNAEKAHRSLLTGNAAQPRHPSSGQFLPQSAGGHATSGFNAGRGDGHKGYADQPDHSGVQQGDTEDPQLQDAAAKAGMSVDELKQRIAPPPPPKQEKEKATKNRLYRHLDLVVNEFDSDEQKDAFFGLLKYKGGVGGKSDASDKSAAAVAKTAEANKRSAIAGKVNKDRQAREHGKAAALHHEAAAAHDAAGNKAEAAQHRTLAAHHEGKAAALTGNAQAGDPTAPAKLTGRPGDKNYTGTDVDELRREDADTDWMDPTGGDDDDEDDGDVPGRSAPSKARPRRQDLGSIKPAKDVAVLQNTQTYNMWSDEARAAALEARRASASASAASKAVGKGKGGIQGEGIGGAVYQGESSAKHAIKQGSQGEAKSYHAQAIKQHESAAEQHEGSFQKFHSENKEGHAAAAQAHRDAAAAHQKAMTANTETRNQMDPHEASKQAAGASLITEHPQAREHAVAAMDASGDDDSDSAADFHAKAAKVHDRAATAARRDEDEDGAQSHEQAAMLNRRAASAHAVAPDDVQNARTCSDCGAELGDGGQCPKCNMNSNRRRPANTNNRGGSDMDRKAAIDFITTNCDCWKGKGDRQVLNGLTDGKLAEIKRGVEQGAADRLVANAARAGFKLPAGNYSAPSGWRYSDAGKLIRNDGGPASADAPGNGHGQSVQAGGEEDDDEDDGNMFSSRVGKGLTGGTKVKKTETMNQYLARTGAPREVVEAVTNAAKITGSLRTRLVAQLTANARTDEHRQRLVANYSRFSLDDLRDAVDALPTANAYEQVDVPQDLNFLGAGGGGITDNIGGDGHEDDGGALGLPSMNFAAEATKKQTA